MKAWLIEDDYEFRKDLGDVLSPRFPSLLIENFDSVSAFETQFESLAKSPAELVILDIMIPWEQSEITRMGSSSAPLDFDPYRGGMRILQKLSDDVRTCRVPIIILSAALDSVLREGTKLPSHVIAFNKPTPTERIIETIKAITFGRLKAQPQPLHSKFAEAVEAKPGWFGITFDVKKLKSLIK